MLGFADWGVTAAYLLCLASTLLCVVYGILNWNSDDDGPAPVPPSDQDIEFEESGV